MKFEKYASKNGLPRPPLRRAEGGTGFGRRIAEQLGEGAEHRETMLVIRLAGQSRGQALGRGLRSAKGPQDTGEEAPDYLDRTRRELAREGVELAQDALDRAGTTVAGQLVDLVFHRFGARLATRTPTGWSSGDADVLDESTAPDPRYGVRPAWAYRPAGDQGLPAVKR